LVHPIRPRAALDRLTDPDVLAGLGDRLLDAASWDDLGLEAAAP
jgi:hypothetical protein